MVVLILITVVNVPLPNYLRSVFMGSIISSVDVCSCYSVTLSTNATLPLSICPEFGCQNRHYAH